MLNLKLYVTALVERRHVWDRLVQMKGTTRAMVHGKLCYPRVGWEVLRSYMQNHKSWDVAAVKVELGAKMEAYFFQGAPEYVFPGHLLPSFVEPMGAVPKKCPDEFLHISNARRGNKWLADWGVRYFSARDLAFALSWRAIVNLNGHDINDGYHRAVLAGCTGQLVWGWGIVKVEYLYPSDADFEHPVEEAADCSFQQAPGPHSQHVLFVFGWRLHVGCWYCNCAQTCDKSYTGMFFDGCVCRWAVVHFGQKPACSPLNCIALCLLRHAALWEPVVGELRGFSLRSLLCVVWVDDFTFYRPVPWHPPCAGLAGGCPTCLTTLVHAEALDEWWMGFCGKLEVTQRGQAPALSANGGNSGFLFDTLRSLMLVTEPKQEMLLANAAELGVPESVWTTRQLDSIKGRLLHYSAAIRHLRIRVAELARLIGPIVEASYDQPLPAPAGLPELAADCADLI